MARITVLEGLQWVVEQLRDKALDLVPDEGQLKILTTRMRNDRDWKQAEYQKALSAEVRIQHPQRPEEGTLPRLRAKLERREKQGAQFGEEYKTANRTRKTALMRQMQQCSDDINAIKRDIATQESLLKTCRETTELRRTAYEAAKADLKKLEQIAPTILAQTKALEDAQRERLRAAADNAQGTESPAGALLAEYQAELEKAQAGASAAEIMLEESEDEEIDLDALEEAEAQEAEADERIAAWIGK